MRSTRRAIATIPKASINQPRLLAPLFTALNTSPPVVRVSLSRQSRSPNNSKRMTTRHLTISWQRAAWPALAGLAVIVAHLPSFVHRLLDGDEAIYGSIAVLMNLGGGLYASPARAEIGRAHV